MTQFRDRLRAVVIFSRCAPSGMGQLVAPAPRRSGAALAVHGKIGAVFKCLGPALVEPFNAEVRALAPEDRVDAVAASLESVWP